MQAKTFEVIDDSGNVLVKLGAYKNAGVITTYTDRGKELVDILKNVDGNGAVVGFNSSEAIAYRLTGTTSGGGVLIFIIHLVKKLCMQGQHHQMAVLSQFTMLQETRLLLPGKQQIKMV